MLSLKVPLMVGSHLVGAKKEENTMKGVLFL